MNIKLTNEESLEYFYNSLCNAAGIDYMSCYNLELQYNKEQYQQAKEKLDNPCYEDVLIQILKDGGWLRLQDLEDMSLEDSNTTKTITLKDVHEKVQLTPFNHLSDMINENDDATTADVILQTVFYGEIIFG